MPKARKIVFKTWKAETDVAEGLDLELSTGESIHLPAPILWPEPLTDMDRKDAKGLPDPFVEENGAWAVRILDLVPDQDGAEAWAAFVADGGDWGILNRLLIDAKGLPAGE